MSQANNAAALRSHGKRQAPETSVHMSVLGLDGEDHEVHVVAASDNGRTNNNTNNSGGGPHYHPDNMGENKKSAPGAALGISGSSSRPTTPGRSRQSPPSQPTTPSRTSPTRKSTSTMAGLETSGPAASDANSWWGKMPWGKAPTDEDDASSQYQSLEIPDGDESSRTSLAHRMMMMGSSRGRNDAISPVASLMASSSTVTTVEDRLKKDCSFFYQGIEDGEESMAMRAQKTPGLSFLPGSAGGGLRPLSTALNHQMPRLLSSREGARFQAHYQRLNQDVIIAENDDLILDEYYHSERRHPKSSSAAMSEVIEFSSAATTSQNTGKLSTLFFEQDGRLLMKLPRDQVRLIMDPDLEPGIISVEQWRRVDRNSFDPVGPAVGADEDMMPILEGGGGQVNGKNSSQPPELRYVMTVPDDLYRRVVAEMSYSLLPPCWGFFQCCNGGADGKADIKLALGIFGFILFLLFICTLVWPTE